MQEKWDDIDRAIFDSNESIEPSHDFNERLMKKIHSNKCENKPKVIFNSNRIAAASLIMAGMLMLMVFTTGIQYRIVEVQCEIKSRVMLIQNQYNKFDLLKYFNKE